MKALSLWQPWASAMALGLKSIETRGWSSAYRGPLAIHAAKRWTREEREFLEDMRDLGRFPQDEHHLPFGAIVAVGMLRDIRRTEQVASQLTDLEESWGNYGPHRYGWIFQELRPLPEPIPFRGAQGFFDVPDELFAEGYWAPPAQRAGNPAPPRQGALVL